MIDFYIASNALGVVAGLLWIICGLYVLGCAKRCEVSIRAAVAAALVAWGGWLIAQAFYGRVQFDIGIAMVVLSLLTLFGVGTQVGRQVVGMSGWGLTAPDEFHDTTHVK